ncbi:MAG TPA: hypothetical protein VHS80_04250 [Chthoniobacterales bacterium]|nr:hypothetical protein [Chthoniobacterales bacterium]
MRLHIFKMAPQPSPQEPADVVDLLKDKLELSSGGPLVSQLLLG